MEVQGESIEALAFLDTGYTGSLIVPETFQSQALSHPDARTSLQVGDAAPVYLGILKIKGFPLMYGIAVTLLGDEYLLGRRILDRFEITLDLGQRVIIKS